MEFTVGFAGYTAEGKLTRCEEHFDTDTHNEPATLQGAYATAIKSGIAHPDYIVINGYMYYPGKHFDPDCSNV